MKLLCPKDGIKSKCPKKIWRICERRQPAMMSRIQSDPGNLGRHGDRLDSTLEDS
jgi:hypothetical protein